ncbi:Uncharacterised protein [Mycobacterium tuberculosis]|nr:Uncharacterised protein [Mycobacterium tuberculosis]
MTATPTRTGRASAADIRAAAWGSTRCRSAGLRSVDISDGSGSISVPIWVPAGVLNP